MSCSTVPTLPKEILMILELMKRLRKGRTNCRPREKMAKSLRFELRKRVLSELNRRMRVIGVTAIKSDALRCRRVPHHNHIAHTIMDVVRDVGEQYKVRMPKEFVVLANGEIGVWISVLGRSLILAKGK